MRDSLSPVIIRHRKNLTEKTMRKIAKLFPEQIRVEFQKVTYEDNRLYGMEGSSYWGGRPLDVNIVSMPGSINGL